MYAVWAGNALQSPRMSWRMTLGREMSGIPYKSTNNLLFSLNPRSNEQRKKGIAKETSKLTVSCQLHLSWYFSTELRVYNSCNKPESD